MTEHIDHDDLALDRRLAADVAALHADLDTVLDLDTGLANAILPGHVEAFTDDLDQVLDLGAGLEAVFSATQPPNTSTQSDPGPAADNSGAEPATQDTRDVPELLRFARKLAACPAEERLRIRQWLPFAELGKIDVLIRTERPRRELLATRIGDFARDLVTDLDHVRDFLRDLAHDLDHGPDLAHIRGLDPALAIRDDLDLVLAHHHSTLARIRDLDAAFGPDLSSIFGRVRNQDDEGRRSGLAGLKELIYSIDNDVFAVRTRLGEINLDLIYKPERVVHSDHDQELADVRNSVRSLNRILSRVHDVVLGHEDNIDRDLSLDHALGRLIDVLRTRPQRPMVSAFISAAMTDRTADELQEEDLRTAVTTVTTAVSDMVGADLEKAQLTGIPLHGVHWSSTTKWPPSWRDRVYRQSVQVGPDLWRIGHRGRGIDVTHLVPTT